MTCVLFLTTLFPIKIIYKLNYVFFLFKIEG